MGGSGTTIVGTKNSGKAKPTVTFKNPRARKGESDYQGGENRYEDAPKNPFGTSRQSRR